MSRRVWGFFWVAHWISLRTASNLWAETHSCILLIWNKHPEIHWNCLHFKASVCRHTAPGDFVHQAHEPGYSSSYRSSCSTHTTKRARRKHKEYSLKNSIRVRILHSIHSLAESAISLLINLSSLTTIGAYGIREVAIL